MFYQIDSSLDNLLETSDPSFTFFIEEALTAHRMSNIILVLSRNQMKLIEGSLNFGLHARRTVSLISQKANDYRAAMRYVSRVLVITDAARTNRFQVSGKYAYVNWNLVQHNHVLWQSLFLCEHVDDANFYSIIARDALSFEGYPSTYLGMRTVGGGGSTLFQALHAEVISPLKGVAICDADTLPHPPPFKAGSTAKKAYETAVALKACDCCGMNDLNPMFGLFIAPGLSVENCVGPFLLDQYFSVNNRPSERAIIAAAFRDFPNLDEAQYLMWQSLNLKSGTPSIAMALSYAKSKISPLPVSVTHRTNQMSKAVIPSDVIPWVNLNRFSSRASKDIERAIRRDLAISSYRLAIEPIVHGMRDLLAGDQTARTS